MNMLDLGAGLGLGRGEAGVGGSVGLEVTLDAVVWEKLD